MCTMTLSNAALVTDRMERFDINNDAADEIEMERQADRWSSEREAHERAINVGRTERQVSTLAGVALALLALRQRSIGGLLMAGVGAGLVYRGATGHCPMYEALDIDTSEEPLPARPEEYFDRGVHVEHTQTIDKSPEELYAFWRNFTNLPRIMRNLKSVTCLDENRSHWIAIGPMGYEVEWDAEIINDEPNQTIAWRSLADAEVDNAGSVRFVPARDGRGTEVKVVIDYIPPMGHVGASIAKMFGRDPETEIREDVCRFKQVMERGEVETSQDQPTSA
jgi:uncharacterized membrane protein